MKFKYSISAEQKETSVEAKELKGVSNILSDEKHVYVVKTVGKRVEITTFQKGTEEAQQPKTAKAVFDTSKHCLPDLLGIQAIHFDGEACFFVTSDPVQLYFVTPKTEDLIKVQLEQPISLEDCSFQFRNQILYIYGHNREEFKNKIVTISLLSFQLKKICEGKGYSPAGREEYISIFDEDRLYVFGGKDKKGKPCEELLWTYDFDKGYWFALQLKLPFSQQDQNFYKQSQNSSQQNEKITNSQMSKHRYETGKYIFERGQRFYMIELYQSRCTQVIASDQKTELPKGRHLSYLDRGSLWIYDGEGALSLVLELTQEK